MRCSHSNQPVTLHSIIAAMSTEELRSLVEEIRFMQQGGFAEDTFAICALTARASFQLGLIDADDMRTVETAVLNEAAYRFVSLTTPNPAAARGAPKIVCAAVQSRTLGHVAIGPRHLDAVMRKNMNAWLAHEDLEWDMMWSGAIEGFIDQHGQFYTRTEAWKVAEVAGQIRFRCGGDDANGGTLYSENLY